MNVELIAEEPLSRYVVGIDLGTTNSAACYVDCAERPWKVRVLEIPQYVAPGQIEARQTLPSFHYQPPAAVDAPVPPVIGFMARDYGAATPERVIFSAKSWLCHTGIDRTANVLPWRAASDVERISPIAASSRYLTHIRACWDKRFPSDALASQDIVLTLPASFDEIARELTIEAAATAGLSRVVLLEEPQAAFYAWIYKHQQDWDGLVSPGQKILVCDIGGGTTDFTLIRVRRGENGKIQFHRVAVGDHLILGGDNMDLSLAKFLEAKIVAPPKTLDQRQWESLLRVSRQLKEQSLADEGPEELTVCLPGTSSKLIGSEFSTKVTRHEVQELLVDGFMPRVALMEKPAARRSGFQEFGLPYAADAGITRHLATFLTTHRCAGEEEPHVSDHQGSHDPARPDVVLFNGGVFESRLLRERLLQLLEKWFDGNALGWHPTVLDNDRLDLAVARGAAYYGMVRRGDGEKIVASLARTYYIGLESEPPTALCLVPGNAEPGQTIELPDREFDLVVSEPVEFPLYTSSIRLTDKPGQLVPIDREQMTALPPIRTALKTRSRRERGTVAVRLHGKLSEIGTLELWCREIGGERIWRLQFDVRSATQTDIAAHHGNAEQEGIVDERVASDVTAVLSGTFGLTGNDDPNTLIKRLVAAAGSDRDEWPTSLLRRIWEVLIDLKSGRRKSPAHEARWLNLLGYALRPGYGLAVDDWRVAETWKTVQGKLAHVAAVSRTESLILWRRIAGGLTSGQQRALAEPLMAAVRTLYKKHISGGKTSDVAFSPHESLEMVRLVGSLEQLPTDDKIELGKAFVALLRRKKLSPIHSAVGWAIGRLGARELAYGPLNAVVPAAETASWIENILELERHDAIYHFVLVNLARRTGDRFRDIDDPLRGRVVEWLQSRGASEHATMLVSQGGQLEVEEQVRVFGEALPKGLALR